MAARPHGNCTVWPGRSRTPSRRASANGRARAEYDGSCWCARSNARRDRSLGCRKTPRASHPAPRPARAGRPQVTGVHAREERVGRPVGFEVRLAVQARLVDLVLVGIEHVDVGKAIDRKRDLEERIGREDIVVIEKADELTGCYFERGVRRTCDVTVLATKTTLMRSSSARYSSSTLRTCGCFRSVVGDAQFPVRIGLRTHRLDRFA